MPTAGVGREKKTDVEEYVILTLQKFLNVSGFRFIKVQAVHLKPQQD